MHRNRWSALYLLSWLFLGSGCANREHTVLGPRAGDGPDIDFDNPAAAGSKATILPDRPPVPTPRETLPIECRGSGPGICETVPMVNPMYSECFDVVLPPDPDRRRLSCKLIWRAVSTSLVPFSCEQFSFAEPVDLYPPGSMIVTCNIHQLAVTDGTPEPGEGFYWVDAAHVDPPCIDDPAAQGRIMYTSGAMPLVPAVVTWLDCD